MIDRIAHAAVAVFLLVSLALPHEIAAAATASAADMPRTFERAFFARFAPKTALDMVRQLPGFSIREPKRERGLKPTVNLLINGRRVSGSGNSVAIELRRIPASAVIRIEILEGASLEIPGLSGQVANVIAKFSRTSGQFAWRPQLKPYAGDWVHTDGEASISGSSGRFGFSLGVANDAVNETAAGETRAYGPAYDLREIRLDRRTRKSNLPSVSGSVRYEGFDDAIGSLSLSMNRFLSTSLETRQRTLSDGQVRSYRLERQDRDTSYELSGEYESKLDKGRLKLSFLHAYDRTPYSIRETDRRLDGRDGRGVMLEVTGTEKTSTVRGEYRLRSGATNWIIATEVGKKKFINVARRSLLVGSEFDRNSEPSTDVISERRAEGAVTYKRPLSEVVSLQAQVGGESSSIRAGGDNTPEREMFLPEGFLSLAWKASPRLNIDAKLEREVSDLSFLFFVPAENFSTNTRRTGNASLVPPQSWELELSASYSFKAGRSSLRLYGQRLQDVLEIVPVGEDQEAFGNIRRATVLGVESRSTINFDRMGWPGTKLDVRLEAQEGRVRDPVTGFRRRLSGSLVHSANAALRRDVPKSQWAWGASVNYRRVAFDYRPTEIGFFRNGPVFGTLFLENKDIAGFTVRGTVENVLGATTRFRQERYPLLRNHNAPFTSLEEGRRSFGPTFLLSISGRFGKR